MNADNGHTTEAAGKCGISLPTILEDGINQLEKAALTGRRFCQYACQSTTRSNYFTCKQRLVES